MIKTCIICGKPFEAERNAKTCSKECSAERQRRYEESIPIEYKRAKMERYKIRQRAKAIAEMPKDYARYAERQKAESIAMYARVIV